jgi:predicted permease
MELRERLSDLWHDVHLGGRGLGREPLFAGFTIVLLALGIGANAAIFGVVDRLLLRGPDGVRDPDRVVRWFQTEHPDGRPEFTTSVLGYVSYEGVGRLTRSFSAISAYAVRDATTGRGEDARKARAGYATAGFFPMLGVRAAAGRFFDAEEDSPNGARNVVVLSHGTWQRLFGGEPSAIGRDLAVGDETFTIVGVAPRGFNGVDLERVDLWIPMSILGVQRGRDWRTAWYVTWLRVVGRLAPGVTLEQATSDLTAAHRAAYAGEDRTTARAVLRAAPLWFNGEGRESAERPVARWLMGIAAAVLAIACANVANLFLARAMRRRREVAVRVALGAGRARLARLFLIEGLLLAIAGAAAGLAVAWGIAQLARSVLLPDIEWTSSPLDARVLIVSAFCAVVTGIVVGIVPLLRIGSLSLGAALKTGLREGGGRSSRLRTSLTVAQAGLSFALLIGAGLFVRSMWNVRGVALGFDPDRVLAASVVWPNLSMTSSREDRQREMIRRLSFMSDALERVRALPGVEHATLSIGVPYGEGFGLKIRVPGLDSIPKLTGGGPYVRVVTTDYFATMGTRLVRGRAFTDVDRPGGERVVIVSETMAATLWPNGDALGRCVLVGVDSVPCARVVGVVADTRRSQLREEPAMQYYIPLGQSMSVPARPVLLIRAAADPASLVAPVRQALLGLDPALGYVDALTMREFLDPQTRSWQLGATVFGLFGMLALLVAGAGLYSVVAYSVVQRTREIAVRVALGASARRIAAMVLGSGVGMTVVGLVVGIGIAFAAGAAVEPLLFETSAHDPIVFAVVSVLLLTAATLASLIPASRARRVDPMTALREE